MELLSGCLERLDLECLVELKPFCAVLPTPIAAVVSSTEFEMTFGKDVCSRLPGDLCKSTASYEACEPGAEAKSIVAMRSECINKF